jgi:2-dehydro-3-deoxyphosphogluconate aldolase / (4S)-4-hydroxy-2-oxoglutarate aldolase
MDMLSTTIFESGLVPVIKIDDADCAPALGNTLVRSGFKVAEVTFRTNAAEEAIRRMSSECPGLLVGAGTVTSPELATRAVAAGARFVVSPGFNPATVDWCLGQGIPILPGVNNPSMIEAGLVRGLEVFKFFPAEASGGLPMLDAMTAPFGGIKFMPTGGINLANLGAYAAHTAVLAIGGSWMVKPELIAVRDWDTIGLLCSQAMVAVQGFEFAHLGINQPDPGSVAGIASIFESLGFTLKDGKSSTFAGGVFEVMKSPSRGTNGHLALRCNSVERALVFLKGHGFSAVAETAKTDKGVMRLVYLDKEISGFAVHLVRV